MKKGRLYLLYADALLSTSDSANLAARCLPSISRAVIPTINIDFKAALDRRSSRLPARRYPTPWFGRIDIPVMLAVGKLKPRKDYPTLLRVIARVRNARAVHLLILD